MMNVRFVAFGWVVVILGSSGCGVMRHALPGEYVDQAQMPGMPAVRDWGDGPSEVFQQSLVDAIRQTYESSNRKPGDPSKPVYALALSGGGPNGAFGAGVLCGWTKQGDRPKFNLVTGISTGSLAAPFVFLGPEYDDTLRELYTTRSSKNIFRWKMILPAILSGDSLADTSPLASTIAHHIDQEFMEAVAREHQKGRRLYIGTTNLDARRLMVWDMGAIACSGHQDALDLFRNVMRASSAIPVAFPPVYMPVEAGGQRYDEMHVDGGVTTEVFFHGFMIDFDKALTDAGATQKPELHLFVIRNSQIRVPYKAIEPSVFSIASRAMDGLISAQGVGDLYRIYVQAQKDNATFQLASIPSDFQSEAQELIDPRVMRQLFDLGYTMAAEGYPWQTHPPGLEN